MSNDIRWPAHGPDDIGYLMVKHAPGEVVSAPTGWRIDGHTETATVFTTKPASADTWQRRLIRRVFGL